MHLIFFEDFVLFRSITLSKYLPTIEEYKINQRSDNFYRIEFSDMGEWNNNRKWVIKSKYIEVYNNFFKSFIFVKLNKKLPLIVIYTMFHYKPTPHSLNSKDSHSADFTMRYEFIFEAME